MLDAIGAGSTHRIGERDWADVWADSEEFAEVKRKIVQMKEDRAADVSSSESVEQKEYATPMMFQIKQVVRRQNLSFWR